MSAEKMTSTRLEPRVAKLEVGLDRLTDDVRDLAMVVRTQGTQMEQEIQKLVVAVTQASGPRKTDWSTIIAAVMLVMAIGSAAFWPLHQTAQESKVLITSLEEKMNNHSQTDLHPAGRAIAERIDQKIEDMVSCNMIQHKTLTDRLDLLEESNRIDIERMKDELTVYRLKDSRFLDKTPSHSHGPSPRR